MSLIDLQGEYAVWKGHTQLNTILERCHLQVCTIIWETKGKHSTTARLELRFRQVFNAQTQLQMWVFTGPQQDSPQPQLPRQERGKAESVVISLENQSWKEVLARLIKCWLACINYNSQALTARCFCLGSFCVAYCCSGIPSELLRLAFSPVGAANTSPPQTTSSPRKGPDTRV